MLSQKCAEEFRKIESYRGKCRDREKDQNRGFRISWVYTHLSEPRTEFHKSVDEVVEAISSPREHQSVSQSGMHPITVKIKAKENTTAREKTRAGEKAVAKEKAKEKKQQKEKT